MSSRLKECSSPRRDLSPGAGLQKELPVPEKQGSVGVGVRAVEKRMGLELASAAVSFCNANKHQIITFYA